MCNCFIAGNKAWANPLLIISDSMLSYLPEMKNTQLQAFKGLKSDRLLNKIRNKVVTCYGVKNVIVHVGTNDIYDFTTSQFESNIRNAIFELRKYNPECVIFLSSILPRPVDFKHSKDLVLSFNQALQVISNSVPDVRYMSCDKVFVSSRYGFPIRCLYSADKLHLSTTGLNKFHNFVANTLAHANSEKV